MSTAVEGNWRRGAGPTGSLERSGTGRGTTAGIPHHRQRTLLVDDRISGRRSLPEKVRRRWPKRCLPNWPEDQAPEHAARGLVGLAWLQGQRADGVEQSAATFRRLLRQYPDSPLVAEAAVLCGQSLEKAGHATTALEMYQVVVDRYQSSPPASAAMLSAAIDDQLQQDKDAETLLRTWLAAFPAADQRDAALYQLAWVLVDQGRDEEADPVFEQLRSEYRGSRFWADATYRLAERAVRAADLSRADELAAAIVDDATQSRMTSYALFLRGQLAATRNAGRRSSRWMGRLLAEYPASDLKLPAEYWLAESHYRLKHYAQAGILFDQLEPMTVGRTRTRWLAMIPLPGSGKLATRDSGTRPTRLPGPLPNGSRIFRSYTRSTTC